MKKRLLSLIAFGLSLCSLCVPLSAQITHAPQGNLDRNATEILKKAAGRFNQNVSFAVTVTMLDGQKKQLAKQTAQVLYHKGRYHLSMQEQELICDGTTVWQWNKQAREVTITKLGTDEIDLLNPGRLLAGYEQSFKAKYIRTDDDGTAIIDLTPRSARSYHKIRLFVNEESGLLHRMEVHKYDSGREIYNISGFKRTATPSSTFTFDAAKHPEVEIIDMR